MMDDLPMNHSLANEHHWSPLPDDWQADVDRVDLFAIDLTQPPILIPEAMSLLDEVERQRVERFKSPKRQREFVIGRAVLRMLLGSVLRIDPQAVRFEHSPQGKPFLLNDPVHFNVSHSHDMVLLGVSLDTPLGVDIERVVERDQYLKLAKRFFAPGEYDAMIALPAEQHLAAFHAIWTRKGAFVKATAKGIALGLDQFQVNADPLTPAKLEIPHPQIPDKWSLCDLPIANDNYRACLCVATDSPQYRCWQMGPN